MRSGCRRTAECHTGISWNVLGRCACCRRSMCCGHDIARAAGASVIQKEVFVCYSAQIEADYRKYVKMFGADIEIIAFTELFFERVQGSKAKVPKGVEDAFAHETTDGERKVKALIDEFNAQQVTLLEQDLFTQRERLARAERA